MYYVPSSLKHIKNERRIRLEFKSNKPIYLQVVDDIKKQIVNGTIKPGDKLLSTRELAISYTINPNTSMRVYSELESEGITFTKRGLGTFVSEDEALISTLKRQMAETIINDFISDISAIGFSKEELIDVISKKYN